MVGCWSGGREAEEGEESKAGELHFVALFVWWVRVVYESGGCSDRVVLLLGVEGVQVKDARKVL